MKEVFFAQEHHPGELGASDFCHMTKLGVTISGQPFAHLLYHFVLTYSNWETGSICFSESFESLSEGLQKALWTLGGVPRRHRTDSLTAAVTKPESPEEFTKAYQGLLRHYGIEGEKTNAGRPNENGDVEQRHNRTRTAIDQALMLRGSRDFGSREEYQAFLVRVFGELNAGRQSRLNEELAVLGALPSRKLDSGTRIDVRVGPTSTIRVKHNTYSVPSRLIGEKVQVRLYAEHIEVWYAQRLMERMGRLRGEILKLAYEERMREERVQAYDVTITQLMLVIHDWPLAGDTFCQGEHNFDREEIGRREYNRKHEQGDQKA